MTEYQVTKVEVGPLLASTGPFTSFMLPHFQDGPASMTTMERRKPDDQGLGCGGCRGAES